MILSWALVTFRLSSRTPTLWTPWLRSCPCLPGASSHLFLVPSGTSSGHTWMAAPPPSCPPGRPFCVPVMVLVLAPFTSLPSLAEGRVSSPFLCPGPAQHLRTREWGLSGWHTRGLVPILAIYSKPWSPDCQPRVPVWQRVFLIGSTVQRLDLLSGPKLKSVITAWDLTRGTYPSSCASTGQ